MAHGIGKFIDDKGRMQLQPDLEPKQLFQEPICGRDSGGRRLTSELYSPFDGQSNSGLM